MNRPILLFAGVFLLLISPTEPLRSQTRLSAGSGRIDGDNPHSLRASQTSHNVSERRVTLHVRDTTLKYVLLELARRASLKIIYDNTDPVVQKRVSLSIDSVPVLSAFSQALSGTGLTSALSPDNNTVVISRKDSALSRPDSGKGSISGMVVDSSTGKGVVGATVVLSGNDRSTITELTGKGGGFILRGVSPGSYDLTVRFLGFSSRQMRVRVVDGEAASVRIQLVAAVTALNEVVTTVTGEQRKLEIGNSIATINVDSVIAVTPVSNLTDVLENRVPGLTVQRAGGRPGDPARIRLRGSSSINNSNDVIVVVDGVRVESGLSEFGAESQAGTGTIMTTSPIDQIDINSIEKIDVFKGPSAAAMYGSDAANGVIVITTKRGTAGSSKWTASMDQGVSYVPGKFPEGVFRFVTAYESTPLRCNVSMSAQDVILCGVPDSIVTYQALNDPYFNILSNGRNSRLTTSVSGGSAHTQFSLTATQSNDLGVLKMSPYVKDRYQNMYGADIPAWMERPDQYKTLALSSALSIDINSDLRVDLTSKIYKDVQKRTSLGTGGVKYFMNLFHSDTILSLLNDRFNEQSKRNSDKFTSAVSIRWSKITWLPVHSTIGLNRILENDRTYLPRGILLNSSDSAGRYAMAKNVREGVSYTATSAIPAFTSRLITTIGINGMFNNAQAFRASTTSLPPGISEPTSGFTDVSRSEYDRSSSGWFVEPRLNFRSNFFISPGFRLDQNGLQGGKAGLMRLPKINLSWLASESEMLPLPQVIGLLRFRMAAGSAGIQPGIQDRLRLYGSDTSGTVPAMFQSNYMIKTLGNSKLRPERSTEYEWGVDLDMMDGRLGFELTQYNKIRRDAIISVSLAPSLAIWYGNTPSIGANIGEIQNKGAEIILRGALIESSSISLGGAIGYSNNSNRVNKLDANSDQFALNSATTYGTESRVVAGYPLWGIWARPIVGYADLDNNGSISREEVKLADSSTYLGHSEPKGILNLSSYISTFRGQLSLNVNGSFTHGGSQISAAMADPNSPFNTMVNLDQSSLFSGALAAASHLTGYGLVQRVDTWRLNSMTIRYMVPQSIVSQLRSRSLSISLSGNNLLLRSSYLGIDPNVNTSIYEDGKIADDGAIPPTRSWSLKISLGN